MWGLDKGYCLRTLMCHSSCNSLEISADGALIASGHFDGTLRFWDLRSGRQAHEVAGLHSQQITSVSMGLRQVPLEGCYAGMPTVHAFASAPARSACMRRACTAQPAGRVSRH